MFSLPDELQSLIYLFDPTYHEQFTRVRNELATGWGVVTVPYMGTCRPASIVRWGLTRKEAISCTGELRRAMGLRATDPDWVVSPTFLDVNNVPLLISPDEFPLHRIRSHS